jgi:hypothetical protein
LINKRFKTRKFDFFQLHNGNEYPASWLKQPGIIDDI